MLNVSIWGDLGKVLEHFHVLYFGRPELESRLVELEFWWEVFGLDWEGILDFCMFRYTIRTNSVAYTNV
jgi:hypothetical protein